MVKVFVFALVSLVGIPWPGLVCFWGFSHGVGGGPWSRIRCCPFLCFCFILFFGGVGTFLWEFFDVRGVW